MINASVIQLPSANNGRCLPNFSERCGGVWHTEIPLPTSILFTRLGKTKSTVIF